MPSVFRTTTEADLGGIERVFRLAFHPPDDAQILDRAMLRWKYYAPREDWPGSRSFVIEKDGRIVAHAAVWPYEMLVGDTTVRGVHLIDWAADAPGSGIMLVKRIIADTGFMCSFGGTAATRAILPRIGFTRSNDIRTYARPLRPLAQTLTHQYRNWKLPIRFLRNTWWRFARRMSAPTGWTARLASADQLGQVPLPAVASDRVSCRRSAAFFRYLETCPDTALRLYAVSRDGMPRGFFALTLLHRQARVADLWIENATPADYSAVHLLAARVALSDTNAAEIIATSCVEGCSAGLEGAGYHLVDTAPVVTSGPTKTLLAGMPIDFHMVDCDFAFLNEGAIGYTT